MAETIPVQTSAGTLEIRRQWCKGCNLCINACPKHVLGLDDLGKIELKQPDRCTACRMCETICPDYAIRVIKNA